MLWILNKMKNDSIGLLKDIDKWLEENWSYIKATTKDDQFQHTGYSGTIQSTDGKKLNDLFKKAFEGISEFPESGQLLKNGDRSNLVAGYRVVYRVLPAEIHVITIWNSRQNP